VKYILAFVASSWCFHLLVHDAWNHETEKGRKNLTWIHAEHSWVSSKMADGGTTKCKLRKL